MNTIKELPLFINDVHKLKTIKYDDAVVPNVYIHLYGKPGKFAVYEINPVKPNEALYFDKYSYQISLEVINFIKWQKGSKSSHRMATRRNSFHGIVEKEKLHSISSKQTKYQNLK